MTQEVWSLRNLGFTADPIATGSTSQLNNPAAANPLDGYDLIFNTAGWPSGVTARARLQAFFAAGGGYIGALLNGANFLTSAGLVTGLTAANLVRITTAQLLSAGLSPQKAGYIADLAGKVHDGTVDLRQIGRLTDEQVVTRLTQIKGIGRWTAEMFLIFHLMRPNVLPLDDLGLIKGISQNYFSGEPVSRAEARDIAEAWAPYRTVGTWYLWRSLDPVPPMIDCGCATFSAITRPLHTVSAARAPGAAPMTSARAVRSRRTRNMSSYLAA